MIEITRHDDVSRLRMWTMRSAAVGYDVSAYLVRGVLIDTGFRHVESDLIRALTKLRARGTIVTHCHEDHAGNAPMHFTWGRPNPLVASLEPLDFSPLQAIATPGHSADHHVVFDPETSTLFSGDLWLGVRVKVVGAHENPYEILTSLERVIALRPRRMFDAHRGLVDNPVVALTAKKQWLESIVGDIERRLDVGDDERAILRSTLGGEEKTAFFSQGEYSRMNLVRAVMRSRPGRVR
jgi:glyoxylase-like metal-dependent hydrolase (beta-lactamase superfamily II)